MVSRGVHGHERFQRYADSQPTVGEFCAWAGVPVTAFYVWRKKLAGGQQRRRTTASPATAEVALRSSGRLSRDSFLPVRVAERSVATAVVPAPAVNTSGRTGDGATVPATPACIDVRLTNGVCSFVPCTDGGRVMLTCPTHLPIDIWGANHAWKTARTKCSPSIPARPRPLKTPGISRVTRSSCPG